MRNLLFVFFVLFSAWAYADADTKYFYLPSEHTAEELVAVLEYSDQLQLDNDKVLNPVILILFGDEMRLFDRKQYRDNKEIVDLAARLHAFGAIDLRVSSRELAFMHLDEADIPAFFTVVEGLTAEQNRLQDEGYVALTLPQPQEQPDPEEDQDQDQNSDQDQ